MKTLSDVFGQLRRNNKKQYALLAGCLFCSNLLITAFSMMMRSSTVQTVLPEGGDSRKQVMMIFVLAVVGCAAFTLYAAGLFFREKSRETGVFLALGASKQTIGHQLRREVGALSLAACALGLALGTPLSWVVWTVFRLTLANTEEMTLHFDFRAYGIALAFSAFVILALLVMSRRFLKRTNILDIISEAHRAEPIRTVPRWYGWGGVLLTLGGALLGYFVPSFCVLVLHWYPPEGLTSIFYLPALIGLYMLLLHTVVNGWRRGKSRYQHIVSTSMMQFQGRQTVRNMLVITVLTAGAYFAAFYVPLMAGPAQLSFAARPVDYAFHYLQGEDMPSQTEIQALGAKYGAAVKDYVQTPSAVLGVDGNASVEKDGPLGTTYTVEYRELLSSSRFLSESGWNALTGDSLDLAPGETKAVYTGEGDSGGVIGSDIALVTNPVTGKVLPVVSTDPSLSSDALFQCRVLDDGDYAAVTAGLTDEWRETQMVFNAENDSYAFARALFDEIVDRSSENALVVGGYDQIVKQYYLDRGETYFFDEPEENGIPVLDYSQRDGSAFRQNWMYMPQFRVLDQVDFVTSMAVWLLLFVFVSILCFAAVGVILFTRSMTIALVNAWVYDDLRRLGAPNQYLRKTVRGQISKVFFTPLLTGTLLILAFMTMILGFNGGSFDISTSEWVGLRLCAVIVAALSIGLYGLYRLTLRGVCRSLGIGPAGRTE